MERLFNKKELAKYLGISFPTLQKMLRNGELPPPNVGRYWGKSFIERLVETGEISKKKRRK